MNNEKNRNSQKQPYVRFRPKLKKNMGIYGCDSITFENVKMTTDNHVSTFRVYFDIDDVDILALLAIIAKHHFSIRE